MAAIQLCTQKVSFSKFGFVFACDDSCAIKIDTFTGRHLSVDVRYENENAQAVEEMLTVLS